MLGLWASAFPPTPDEAESEKDKGDPYTWQVTLESRSGALAGIGFGHFSGCLVIGSSSDAPGGIEVYLVEFGHFIRDSFH